MSDQTPIPTSLPSTTQTAGPARRTWRWAIALFVSIAMLFAMTGVAVVAQTGETGGPTFVPATAVAYGELRLDLPGDQHDALAAFMAHFPGFADPATFDTKIAELLDQVLSSASKGAATWTGNIKPWSDGRFAVGILSFPTDTGSTTPPPLVLGFGVRDRAALEAQIATLTQGTTPTTQDYNGTTITVSGSGAIAVTDSYLLAADSVAALEASLDTLAGTTPSLTTDADYQAAAADMANPNLGHVFLRTSGIVPLLQQQMASQPGGAALATQLDKLPAWFGAYVQAASDHLTFAGSAPIDAGGFQPTVRATDLSAQFPATTVAYLEVRDLGTIVDGFLAPVKSQLAGDPDQSQSLAAIEQQLGPLDKLLDFVDDAALGIGLDGQVPSVGIVATLNDAAKGGARIQTVLGLLRLIGGGANSPFTVTSSQVKGVTVTTITLRQSAGIPSNLPFTPAISIAVSGGRLYIGLADFAATAMVQDASTSLAAAPSFTHAVGDPSVPNAGLLWVDLATLTPLIEQAAGAQDAAFVTNAGPWLDALDSLVVSGTVDGDSFQSKLVLYVK